MKTIEWNGKPIVKPGIYSGIPIESYHKQLCEAASVSSTDLRCLFSESPAHCYAQWPGNPQHERPEEKSHFILGRAVHHLFLGEKNFSKLFCVQPEEYPDKKTGVLKPWRYGADYTDNWRDRQRAKNLAILTQKDFDNIRGMAESLAKHPIVTAGALNGAIERSVFWKDKLTGLWIKIRPDAIPTSSVDFVDLKSTTSVKWIEIQRALAEYNYQQQGALICEGAKRVLGIDRPTFSLIFIEKKKPWCVRVVTLKDNELARGEKQNRLALDSFAQCLKAKHWPGPGGDREDAELIELPTWAQTQIDTKLQFGV